MRRVASGDSRVERREHPGHPLAESLVERAIATIFTPLELKVTDQDAVAFPSPSGIKSPIDTSHFETRAKRLYDSK